MTWSANLHDILINFDEEISSKNLSYYKRNIKRASFNGNKFNVILNFENVKNFSNSLIDFILSIKKIAEEVNICNLNTTLLPAVYLLHLDQEVKIYTSRYDAQNHTKPIIKRRFKIVS